LKINPNFSDADDVRKQLDQLKTQEPMDSIGQKSVHRVEANRRMDRLRACSSAIVARQMTTSVATRKPAAALACQLVLF